MLFSFPNPNRSETDEGWTKIPLPPSYELKAAHLTARVPVLSIIGAELRLPRVLRAEEASADPVITTYLEVKWTRGARDLGCADGRTATGGSCGCVCRG